MIALLVFSLLATDLHYTFDPNATESRFLLVNQGKSLLYNDFKNYKLVVFSTETGAIQKTIELQDGYWIGNFAYIPKTPTTERALYGLNTLRRSPNGGLERRVMFYNTDFKFVGYALDENSNPSNPLDIFYRQFLTTNDRIFVNIWKRSGIYTSETRMLQQIDLDMGRDPAKDGIDIIYHGSPFLQDFSATDTVTSNVKTKFIITNPNNENQVLVIEELGRIWEFGLSSDPKQNRDLEAKGFHESILPTWISPDRSKDSEPNFFTSFSRVVAAYPLQDGVLIGYRTPVPEIDKAELILQVVGYDMKLGYSLKPGSASILLGACENSNNAQECVWIGRITPERLEIERIPLDK